MEVSTDAGRSWRPADLNGPVLEKAHTRFSYLWNWDGAETEILSRAADDTGYIQPTLAAIAAVRGPDLGYHLNPITAWHIRKDGQVSFKPGRTK